MFYIILFLIIIFFFCHTKKSTINKDNNNCFSEDSFVVSNNNKKIKMKNLLVGDNILCKDNNNLLTYSKITSFLHKEPNGLYSFIKLTLSNKKYTQSTSNHIIKCNGKYIPIRNVKIGDKLEYTNNYKNKKKISNVKVVNREIIYSKGIYAPLTETGNIIVDNVHYSCYANINNLNISENINVVNSLFSIMRTGYAENLDNLMKEYNNDGINWYANALMTFVS